MRSGEAVPRLQASGPGVDASGSLRVRGSTPCIHRRAHPIDEDHASTMTHPSTTRWSRSAGAVEEVVEQHGSGPVAFGKGVGVHGERDRWRRVPEPAGDGDRVDAGGEELGGDRVA